MLSRQRKNGWTLQLELASRPHHEPVVIDILLPATDGGVAFQLGAWTLISGFSMYRTRNDKDFRILAVGVSILVFSAMGVRALH